MRTLKTNFIFKLRSTLAIVFLVSLFALSARPQCSIPPGAIQLTNSFNLTTIPAGTTYYVPAGTRVDLNYQAIGSLTLNGTIIIQDNALLHFNFGGNNFTINNTIQLCSYGVLLIDTLHAISFNNAAATIDAGQHACVIFSHLVNNWNPTQGQVRLNDFASFEMVDYHNFNNSDLNLFVYTGSGTTGVGVGNPLVHFSATNYGSYPSINNAAKNLTASNHIDIVQDNPVGGSGDKPGSANYCGPKAFTNSLACRNNWPALGTALDAACYYQNNSFLLPVKTVNLVAKPEYGFNEISWSISPDEYIQKLELEESQDGKQFNVIMSWQNEPGLILNSNHYADNQFAKPLTYYRLKITGGGEKAWYSQVIKISNKNVSSVNNKFSIFPNPFMSSLDVSLHSELNQACLIRILDLTGKTVATAKWQMVPGNNHTRIGNLDKLEKGIYLIEATCGNRLMMQSKIVKY